LTNLGHGLSDQTVGNVPQEHVQSGFDESTERDLGLLRELLRLSPRLKHPKFIEEKEWRIVSQEIQNQEFMQWEAAHKDVVPPSGWKALGWGFAGLAAFFAIAIAIGILLDATGIAPQ
jgi:hypothetical protein